MATFQITGPDGKKYRVTGDSPEGAMQALRKMVDAPPVARGQGHAGVPEYVPPGVEGYDPETGTVVKNSKTESFLSGAADTAGAGFGDEITAGIVSPFVKEDYAEVRDQIRRNQKRAQSDNPKTFLAGQVGGALAQAAATGGAGFASNAPTLLPRVIGGAATGGAYGALHGAGSGEDMAERGLGALKEGGIGAAVGGAFPVVASGVSALYHRIADALRGGAAARQAGTSPETLRMLGSVMEADDTLGQRGAANMARAGQDAMLADAGPNARAILDTAIQRGGPGGVAARQAIADRTGRSAQAITGALDNTFGQPQGITAARSAIRTGSAAARGNAYDDAYRAAIDYADPRGQALEGLIRGRVPGDIINSANRLMRLGGDESKQIIARVGDDGAVTFERLPDVRQIDYITRALNQAAESGDGAGALGGQTPLGRAYQNLSREIRDTLRDLVPEYGRALETAADPIRRSQAVDIGSRLLSPAMTRDQVDEAVRGMTGPERAALAQGIRSRIDDVMASVTRTVQEGDTAAREAIKALKDLSSRASREKVAAAIGDDQAAQLFAELDRAATSFDLRAAVAENSKTYARQATDRKIAEMTEPGAIGTLAQGKPLNAMQRIAQWMTGQTPERLARRQEDIYSDLARVLTQPAGQARTTLDAITRLSTQDDATRLMAERIARALGGTQTVYPATTLGISMQRDR